MDMNTQALNQLQAREDADFGDPGLLLIIELLREAGKDLKESVSKPLHVETWDDEAEGTGVYTQGFDFDSDPVIDQPSRNRT